MVMTMNLKDPLSYDPSSTAEALSVRFFRKDPKDFPKVTGIGDVVILRRMKVGFGANGLLVLIIANAVR